MIQAKQDEILINGVVIKVYRFVSEDSYDIYLNSGCIQLGKGVFVSATLDQAITVCGLDPKKIDYAIPQPYFDKYYKIFGDNPMLMWDYNKNFFGSPLFKAEIIERFKSIVKIEILETL